MATERSCFYSNCQSRHENPAQARRESARMGRGGRERPKAGLGHQGDSCFIPFPVFVYYYKFWRLAPFAQSLAPTCKEDS